MCVSWSFLASLSVNGGEDGVGQIAQTLQSCLELTEPVQQIQLVKKVKGIIIIIVVIKIALCNNKINVCGVICIMLSSKALLYSM